MKPSDHPLAASSIISLALVLGGFFGYPLFEAAMSYIPKYIFQYTLLIIPFLLVQMVIYSQLSEIQIVENERRRAQQLPQRVEALTSEVAKLATDASMSDSQTLFETREAAEKLEEAAALLSRRLNPASAAAGFSAEAPI